MMVIAIGGWRRGRDVDGLRGTVGEFHLQAVDFRVGGAIDDIQRRLVVFVVEVEVDRMTFAERNQRQAVTTDIAFDLRLRERALIDPGMRNSAGMRGMIWKERVSDCD